VRPRSPVALVGGIITLLLAVVGFAAFSPPEIESSATVEGVVLPPTASGSIAGAALASRLVTHAAPATPAPIANQYTTTAATPSFAVTTTTPPTTSTTARDNPEPATTNTTEAPAPETTTTTAAPPPTTTTAAPPPTTTTTAPPATAAPPPGTPVPAGVEQWRSLTAAYWPAELVDDALVVMDCESGGDPTALNPVSGAAGLFQFMPTTWQSASAAAGWDGASVFDAEANIAAAAWLYAAYETPWAPWSCRP